MEIDFLIKPDEIDGGWVATALNYGITTQADSEEEIKKEILDAVECHFGQSNEKPNLIRLHFSREEILSLS